jgi:diketogulonate reductase-like aldo/keto reductase
MKLEISSTVTLNNGVKLPRLGLGVFRSPQGEATRNAVHAALAAGYRHIDTAAIYRNEADVGAAVNESDVPREDIFVTTKLWNADHGFDEARRALDASLARLGLDYVDLYLIHFPAPGRKESWRALEKLLEEGRARAIGVSNFTRRHLDELLADANVVPAVNQYELHPFGQQQDITDACAEHGIVVEAYCPLVRAQRFEDETLQRIAAETGRTPAQVLVRWSLQRGFVTLPKSTHEQRIVENASVYDFALDDAQMAALDGLEEGFRIAWDPNDAP